MLDTLSRHDLIQTASRKLMPKTIGEMFDWADWLWYHFDTYTNALRGAVRYFLGDIDIESKQDSSNGDERKKIIKELFRDYNIMDLLGRVGDEFIQWGNCFTSIEPERTRKFYCPKCKSTILASEVKDLRFKEGEFKGTCPICGHDKKGGEVTFSYTDTIDDKLPLKINFWNPRLISIDYCPTTKTCEYYASPSEIWKESWSKNDPRFIAETPVEILTALEQKTLIHMNKDFFIHTKTWAPSTREDLLKGWGMPLFMNCFPRCVQIMLLDKFDEAISLDYVVPFRIFSPPPQGGGQPNEDPLRTYNLGGFRSEVEKMITLHRSNPTHIQIAPFPLQYQIAGGEAKQLIPVDLRQQKVQDLLQAMNILDFSQMQGTGGPPPNLRFFEKVWGMHVNNLNRWGQWLCDARTKIQDSTPVNFSLVKSSIYENDMTAEYKVKLGTAHQISMDTALRALGIDYELEQTKLRDEDQRNAEIAQDEQEEAARAEELQNGMYSPQPGVDALMALQQQQQGMGQAPMGGAPAGPGAPMSPGAQGVAAGPGGGDINSLWDQATQTAQQIMTEPPEQRRSDLIALSKDNPTLHAFVKAQIDQMEQQAATQGKAMMRQGQM